MKNNTLLKENPITNNENKVLKMTALLYIMDALFTEKYEECAELIKLAKDFGATKCEIKAIVTEYIKWIAGEYTYEDNDIAISRM